MAAVVPPEARRRWALISAPAAFSLQPRGALRAQQDPTVPVPTTGPACTFTPDATSLTRQGARTVLTFGEGAAAGLPPIPSRMAGSF